MPAQIRFVVTIRRFIHNSFRGRPPIPSRFTTSLGKKKSRPSGRLNENTPTKLFATTDKECRQSQHSQSNSTRLGNHCEAESFQTSQVSRKTRRACGRITRCQADHVGHTNFCAICGGSSLVGVSTLPSLNLKETGTVEPNVNRTTTEVTCFFAFIKGNRTAYSTQVVGCFASI